MIKKGIAISIGLGAAAIAINTTEASAASAGTVTADVLNLRSGAGTNHSIIGKLYEGNKLEILSSSNGWHNVKTSHGKTGWVSSEYVSTSGSSQSGSGQRGKVTASALNVRSGAGTNHSIIGKLYNGNTVEIISSSNGWHNVKMSNGKAGWVSAQYINKSGSSNNNDQNTPSTGKNGWVTASALNVRKGAGTNYSITGKLYNGNKIEIISSSNGWHNVKMSNGKTGWVSAQYINESKPSNDNEHNNPSNGNENNNPSTGKDGWVTASALNVRKGAGTNHSIIGAVYKGNKVEVLNSSNGWHNIKMPNGKIGWTSSQYISESKPTNENESNKEESNNNGNEGSTPSTNARQAVINLANAQIGKPYVWGAEGPNSFDCSGLVLFVYKNAAGVKLPRTSSAQSKFGQTINRSDLQPGDLLFSGTSGNNTVNHVGIYIGNGQMIHAPQPGENVKVANINTSYWNSTYLWAKRVL